MFGQNPGAANILTNTSYALHSSSNSGVPYPVRVYSALVVGSGTTTVGTLYLYNNASAGTAFHYMSVVGTGQTQWDYVSFPFGLLFPDGCWAAPNSRTTFSTITYEVLPL